MTDATQSRERGTGWLIACVVVALCGFAANSLLCRLALLGAGRIDAVSFTAVRLISGGVVLLLLAGPKRARSHGTSVAALALLLYMVAFSWAYLRIGAAMGALLLFGAVQVTMLTAAVRREQRPGPRIWLGLVAGLGGLALLLAPGAGAPDAWGALSMLGAGVAWGSYSLLGRGARDALGATAGNFTRASGPAVLLYGGTGLWGVLHASPAGVALAAASGAIASGLCYAAWYAALPRLGAARAGIVQLLVPVLAAVAAVPVLGESIRPRLLWAGALVLGGVAIALTARRG